MRLKRATWLGLFAPTGAISLTIAAATYGVTGNATAAFAVFATGALSAAVTMLLLSASSHRALAQLRHPELRAENRGAGVYSELVCEAVSLLNALETRDRDATTTKTQLEAKSHVRRKQVQQLEAALHCIDQPVLLTNAHNELQFYNAAAERVLRSTGALQANPGRGPGLEASRIPGLVGLWEQTRGRSAATDSRCAEFELALDGGAAPYCGVATNLYEGETPLGVATILRDIRAERREKTRHAEFVSSVCHELKTPMASIKAFAEMLIDGEVTDADEQKELFGFIELQVERLTRLVNNMLNIARIESGVIEIEREDCGLNELLERAADVVRPTAEEKSISLESELSELYLPVHVDRDLFGQAVINLLSNAVKYTPEGGQVRLRSRLDDDRALIEVRDNGMGIPESSLPRIFERFYRVPENNKAAAGTGLGLALVHYVVTEILGGRIAVESAVGVGTAFTISLPLGHRNLARKKPESLVCVV